jgi:Ca2+-binding RTX toxin-like protein
MTTRRFAAVAQAALLASLLLLSSGATIRAATSWNYGGSSPTCPGSTVQDCVNNAAPGDTILMFKHDQGPDVLINKNVSLRSGDGNHYMVGSVAFDDGASPLNSTVSGLAVTYFITAFLDSSSGSTITIRNNIVSNINGHTGIGLTTVVSATFSVEGNVVDVVGHQEHGIYVHGLPNGGSVYFRVVGNQVSGHGNNDSGAGIVVDTSTSGTFRADIYNNTVWDIARSNAGAASGIAILPSDTVQADVNVVGNTVELSATNGLQQRNDLSAGGHLALDMFNNIFSHAQDEGVALEAGLAGTLTLRAGYNDYFANGQANDFDGKSKGKGNLAVDPKFVNRSNGQLGLQSSSGLINKGQVCSPGGVANPDAANHHRLQGKSVDIGAIERGAGAITGIVIVGGSGNDTQVGSTGADILCGYGGVDTQMGSAGNDFIDGGDAGDTQYGGTGADRIRGGNGADTLCANDGAGTDNLNGGDGNDGFKADSGDAKTSVEHAASCPS